MSDHSHATVVGPTNAGRFYIRFANGTILTLPPSGLMVMFDTQFQAQDAADIHNAKTTT
jgi:hypothetical protein